MADMNDNRRIIEEAFAAYVAGDVGRLTQNFDPEIAWQIVGPPQAQPFYRRVSGRDGVLRMLMTISEVYWLRSYLIVDLIVDGDKAAARAIAEFRHRRTNRLVRVELVQWIRMRNGLIVEFREFHDTLSSTVEAYGIDLDALMLSFEPIAGPDAGMAFPLDGKDR